MKRALKLGVALVVVSSTTGNATTFEQGLSYQGLSYQGLSYQGLSYQGLSYQGLSYQGLSYQGLSYQGLSYQGLSYQGLSYQGLSYQGLSYQGLSYQGLSYQGLSYQGLSYQGRSSRGIDRLGKLGPSVTFRGLELPSRVAPIGAAGAHAVLVPRLDSSVQGLQPNGASPNLREITVDPAQVQLQKGPGDSGFGSYIFVPGLVDTTTDPAGTKAMTGSFWTGVFSDGAETGALTFYIAAVEKDAGFNQSKYPANDDVYLYTVYLLNPATEQWTAACPNDESGRPRAMAVPANPFDRSADGRRHFTFACTASGVAAKCARNWGYKPWKTVYETLMVGGVPTPNRPVDLAPLYDACLIAARADYCQDGQSFTKNGTLVDLFDSLEGGLASINTSAGLPYAPNSPEPMMHEEYQISATSHVFQPDQVMSLPEPERTLKKNLLHSGMQSSRYADLDPGRSCFASDYIDRCDPKEPYACYRAANMSSHAYGSFLAVNSPRHCAHDELTDGPALDPLCNECVNRICQIDPSCCGDPGAGFYPGSLVWDRRCSDLHDQVCRSSPPDPTLPAEHPYNKAWNPGVAAPPPGNRPTIFLSGAIGSFEGIAGGFAEGWACDPDFPGASIPVQISVGGQLGAGTSVLTGVADQPLLPAWREATKAACGGAGRHGFRIAVPAGETVYAYGIDLNVPGAPFTLLRGGKKTVPGPAPSPPRAALWTGWLEPGESGNYAFCEEQSPGVCAPQPAALNPSGEDQYRIWVNGFYVAGNWTDEGAGAFTQPSPGPFTLYLQEGVRYGVRIEYLRPSASSPSSFGFLWSRDGGAYQRVPGNHFHPIGQGIGGGLLGTYYASTDLSGAAAGQSVSAVDTIWTIDKPPVTSGIVIASGFSATFTGQVVPPISGKYTFTADTDGAVKIFVNGQLVTDASRRPPGAGNPDVCSHDICRTGEHISHTCNQGFFCAAQICLVDGSCCSSTWDSQCVEEVARICKLDCTPTPPVTIALAAGTKYDIRVEYSHFVGSAASLHLMWALPGGPRDVIAAERLFTARDLSAPPAGVGINAAYFSDANFADEVLDHVEPFPSFASGSLPGVVRSSLICAAGCVDPDDVLGPPALTEPSGPVTGPNVIVSGVGAGANATVRLYEGPAQVGGDTLASAAGKFSFSVTLPDGAHTLTAVQSVGGRTSSASAPLVVSVGNVIHPDAPGIPGVDQPPGGLVSSGNQLAIGGTGTTGGTVTVKSGDTIVGTFDVVDGRWGGFVTLGGPGSYTLSVTETLGGHTSAAGPEIKARVTLPPLTVDVPADGTVDNPVIEIRGHAPGGLGPVLVGVGDGRSFAERASLPVASDGAFAGSLTLDYGRHMLKFFQRTGGLDGDGVVRAISLRPPHAALAITSVVTLTDGELPVSPVPTVDQQLSIKGGGGLRRKGAGGTGLRGSVIVYQGTVAVGEGPLDDAGNFNVSVKLTGAGDQPLSVAQVARSLSGGGTAESEPSDAVMVKVRPPKPEITSPTTGTKQTAVDVTVAGKALPGADVVVAVDGVDQLPPIAAAAADPPQPELGFFTMPLRLTAGSHRLTAYQEVDGTRSAVSDVVVVAVGDVTPPTLEVVRADCALARDADPKHVCPAVRELVLPEAGDPAPDDAGTTVNLATKVRISAVDEGASLAVTCLPSATDTTRFPLGSSNVTCAATDVANNRGATTFVVTVRSGSGPVIADGDITVEALDSNGAVVNYPLSATGWIADCGRPGAGEIVPCASWNPANKGLGFAPSAVAVNGADGSLYAGFLADADPMLTKFGSLLSSPDHGATWQSKPAPQAGPISQILWAGGATPTLYIPSYFTGLRISTDNGDTWTSALPGMDIKALAIDPQDPKHLFAWNALNGKRAINVPSALFETRDGWASWTNAGEGLPDAVDEFGHGILSTQITGMVIDPRDPDRMYLALPSQTAADYTSEVFQLYRKTGAGPWERLAIPPVERLGIHVNDNDTILGIAPWLTPCDPAVDHPCATHPTVYAGSLMSIDGGENWVPTRFPRQGSMASIAFDRFTPGVIFANTIDGIVRSQDYGRTWTVRGSILAMSLVQDGQQADTWYAPSAVGVFKSTDAGATWAQMFAAEQSLTGTLTADLAPDPANPNVAYLLSGSGGIFKTINGGESWVSASSGFGYLSGLFLSHLEIDRNDTNIVYASGTASTGRVIKTLDGAGPGGWTPLDRYGVMKLDPVRSDTMYLGGTSGLSDGYWTGLGMYEGDARIELTTSDWSEQDSSDVFAYGLQIVPDAARTALISWQYERVDEGGVNVVSTKASRESGPGGVPVSAHWGSVVLYDGSDGTDALYTNGSQAGQDPSFLYRKPLNGGSFDVVGGGPSMNGGVSFTDFSRLLIDPANAGRTMYTLGVGDTLWQSHDAGQTWQQDDAAPSFLTNAWLSPVDGAVYANVSSRPTEEDERRRRRMGGSIGIPGTIWKRTLAKGTPPGARVVQGDVRVSCTGPGGRAVGPGSPFPIGATMLTCTATDVFGNTATRTITITVRDSAPPVITVPARANAFSDVATTVDFTVSAVDAIDGAINPTCDHASGEEFQPGVTSVHCFAIDAAGNRADASFPVIVANGWPTITVPADITADATGPTGAAVTFVASARGSLNELISVTCTPGSGSTFALGVTPVTCRATDPTSGVTAPRSFNVLVHDTTPPEINVPSNPQRITAAGAHGVRFDYTVGATDNVDGAIGTTCVPPSGSTFPLGTTTIVCRAVDAAGNRATAQFDITVADFTPPELLLSDVTAEAQDLTGARVAFTANAVDAEDGTFAADCLPPPNSWFPLHDTTVLCTATDSAGNESRGSFVVHVVDRTAPAINVPAALVVEAQGPDGAVVDFPVSATDAVDGAATPAPGCVRVTGLGLPTAVVPGAAFPLGDSTVTCTSTDAAGNTGSATFTVLVRDTTRPLLHLPDPITAPADVSGTAVVTFAATADDTVAGALPVGCTPKPGSRFLSGTTTVDCSARDGAENEARGTFTVTVTTGGGGIIGTPCTSATQCNGFACVDGVCCATACGGGATNDCMACSVLAGGSADGACTAVQAGRLCRASAGACDMAESCDGASLACPTNRFVSAGATCRASAGPCDVAETCSGSSAACPADALAPPTQVCRAGSGACDVPETCTGSSPSCPGDVVAPATQICRPSVGTCDVAESCTGSSGACPADAFAPATQTCRPSAGTCDVAELCSGSSGTCPADAFAPATQICRNAAGTCDVAERCTGAAASCPADGFVAAGTVCAPAGTCQTPGVCSGAAAPCPVPAPIPGCSVDKTPPAWSNVPGTIIAYATSKRGATVTYTKPKATDTVDGVRPVTCTLAPGSMFPVNKTTVTCTASDTRGNTSSVTFIVWVQYQAPADGSFFLIPIRSDGTSVFRIGRPVPARFKLQGASKDITDLSAKFLVTKISNAVQGTVDVTSDETTDDDDFIFKYRPLLNFYVYRWKTRDRTQGTYQIKADLGDGVTHQVNVSLKAAP